MTIIVCVQKMLTQSRDLLGWKLASLDFSALTTGVGVHTRTYAFLGLLYFAVSSLNKRQATWEAMRPCERLGSSDLQPGRGYWVGQL